MRLIAIPLALALALLAPAAGAEPVMLHETAVVNGGYVRLGDLFANTADKADIIVAYAPEPGKRAIFDARWLYRVARSYRLPWRPMSPSDKTVVRRNSHVIGRQEIEDHIMAALIEKGVSSDSQVLLSNRSLRLYVPGDSSATMAIEDLMLDRRSGRFSAIVSAPADDPAARRIRVTGRLHKMTEIPVLRRRMLSKQVIAESDIAWILIRSDRIQHNTVLDANDLIGKAPRRTVRASAPIRAADVRDPIVVEKGTLVTMLLRTPLMMLTAKGRALENGSKGDTIRVSNTKSNTVIEAVVTSSDTVVVRFASRLAMN